MPQNRWWLQCREDQPQARTHFILLQSNVDCLWDSENSSLGSRGYLGAEAASHVPSPQPTNSFPYRHAHPVSTGTALTRCKSLLETITCPSQNERNIYF
jgi:hypothetical protein